jgi:DNA-binding beta-propeller fold protein YncE
VRLSSDGAKAYVNSLESARTVIYDARSLTKLGVIPHVFGPRQAGLFPGTEPWFGAAFSEDLPPEGANVFTGKPVESEFSHGGRYLWVPYYRRSFDLDGTQPSAAAVIDTLTSAIVRVLPTGPIAKNAAASPDGRYMAIAHWGNNSVGLIDISSADPAVFSSAAVIALGPGAPPPGSEAVNRDLECGLCVRGLAWTADSGILFAGCMGGAGGIGVINVKAPGGPALLGRVKLGGKPRDLLVSPDGRWLYVTASKTGEVLRAETAGVAAAAPAKGRTPDIPVLAARVGGLPRSMKLSRDGRWLYVALNGASQVAVVDTLTMTVASRIAADSFPVGLDISPDGSSLWVTSQGIDGAGGNSVEVFAVTVSSNIPPAAEKLTGLQRVKPPVP